MSRWSRVIRRAHDDERGVVLVFASIALVALFGFVALTVDMGLLALTRRQLQNGADAAAQAGVQMLPSNTTQAGTDARAWAVKNSLISGEVQSVTVSQTSVANDTITVTTARPITYVFASLIGVSGRTVTATAAARVGSVTGAMGLMPFGLVDLNGGGASNGFGYTFGTEVTLKEVPGNHFGPGNYGFLALDGRGGDDLRDTIAQGGSDTTYRVGDEVYTEPGQKTGPVTQGLNSWASSHGDSMGSSCDNWAASHSYTNGRLTVSAQCRYRVILIPIIDAWPNGRHEVTILGFAQMYLAGWDASNGKALDAIFLNEVWNWPGAVLGSPNGYGSRIIKLVQ